jgi:hypothetical protein
MRSRSINKLSEEKMAFVEIKYIHCRYANDEKSPIEEWEISIGNSDNQH